MRFLRAVFGVTENHRMFQDDVLRWKCLDSHPFWEGGRGYALRHRGAIAAFGCVVPCRFLAGRETVASCNVIDWAASKAVPSAGILLYRHIQQLAGTMINIGGTPEARQVLPRIGFDQRVELHHYTRVLRPLRHFGAGRKDWKSPLRVARDYRGLTRHPNATLPFRRADDSTTLSFPESALTGQIVCDRTPELLRYVLACPAAPVELYAIETGYFLLSHVGQQCRIADIWVRSANSRDWAAGYAAAAEAASTDPHATEITAASSGSLQTAALKAAGFRRTHSEPVFVQDPASKLAGRNDLTVGFLENDAFYWSPTPATMRAKYLSS